MDVASPKAPLRLLYVITKSNFGGAQRYVHDLAIAAQGRGHHVVVAAGGNGELFSRLREANISTRSIAAFQRDVDIIAEVKAFFELYRLCKAERPDLVHLNSSKAGLAALAARLAGVKRVIFTVHGWAWNEDRPLFQKFLFGCVYWGTFLLVDIAIAVSNTTRAQGSSLPFVQHKFRVVHNGVRPIDFFSRDDARERLLPDSEKKFWIGTIAELHPVKGLPVLIEAFEHFAPDYPDSELVIIGEGEMRAELERQMKIEGVASASNLVGQVPDASRYLKALDVFVLPSRSESLAYVLLEAGSAELPVVASNVGGIPEVIEDKGTGILVPYGDREGLTNALESFARDETLRKRYGEALKKKVEKEFSLEQMVEQTFALY